MKKVFIPLWIVVGLFFLGLILFFTAAFTTHPIEFSGTAVLHLKFETEDHKAVSILLTDADGKPVDSDAQGAALLHPSFESRETNVFDTFAGGPRPRVSMVVFFEGAHRRHEIQFTYDRRGQVWKAEAAFPDPLILAIELEKSSLDFKATEGTRRRYESAIFAKALVGPMIAKHD